MDDLLTESHLQRVAKEALDQCLSGKGKERHGEDGALEHQPIWSIAGNVGLGFPIGQAMKKLMELRVHNGKAWRREALGAVVYTLFGIMLHDHLEQKNSEEDRQIPTGESPKG